MEPIKISIVTPSFNQGQFLEACIDSILSQNYPNLEYIVMDGGSTDQSVAIIKKYEKYLTFWRSHPDNGHYSAVDEGLKRTTGEVMGWLNSDDMLHKNSLSILNEVFTSHKNVEFVTGQRIGFNIRGDISIPYFPTQQWTRDTLLATSNFHVPHMFVMQEATYWRRSVWERAGNGIDLQYKLAADYELWCRFIRTTPLYTLNHWIGGFRDHGETQRSKSSFDQYIAECENIIIREKTLNLPHKKYYSQAQPVIDIGKDCSTEIISNLENIATYKVAKDSSLAKISVIVPLYQDCPYLEQALHSILIQKWPNLQLILVCPSEKLAQTKVRVSAIESFVEIEHVENPNSIFSLIDHGLKKSDGEINAWLNSSDVYQPNCLYIMSELFKRKPHVDWVTGCVSTVDDQGDLFYVSLYPGIFSRQNLMSGRFFDPFINQESIFFRRTLWLRSGSYLDLNYKLAADYELFLRFSRTAKLNTLNFFLASHRNNTADRYQNMSIETIQEIAAINLKEKSLQTSIEIDSSSPGEFIQRLD